MLGGAGLPSLPDCQDASQRGCQRQGREGLFAAQAGEGGDIPWLPWEAGVSNGRTLTPPPFGFQLRVHFLVNQGAQSCRGISALLGLLDKSLSLSGLLLIPLQKTRGKFDLESAL